MSQEELLRKISALLDSTAQLQRSATVLVSEIARQRPRINTEIYAPSQFYESPIAAESRPASAKASIMGGGVPIPSRGPQGENTQRAKIIANTKARLAADGWPDCEDTDMHAARLSQAMIRLGVEDLDNFNTEASRLNCSNMAVTATLVSAIVATFEVTTFNSNDTMAMQIVNALWLLSLFVSLAVATVCMLVSEWLTWSTSQELRDASILYRMVTTAHRSLFMHLSIFLFFAGLLVLVWDATPIGVCLPSTVACGCFTIYYVCCTVRAPYLSHFFGITQWNDHDFRGLRVQIWTPFSLWTHHASHRLWTSAFRPLASLFRNSVHSGTSLSPDTEAYNMSSSNRETVHQPVQENMVAADYGARPSSRLSDLEEKDDVEEEDAAEFGAKLKATRLRRLNDAEPLRPGRRAKQVLSGTVSVDHGAPATPI